MYTLERHWFLFYLNHWTIIPIDLIRTEHRVDIIFLVSIPMGPQQSTLLRYQFLLFVSESLERWKHSSTLSNWRESIADAHYSLCYWSQKVDREYSFIWEQFSCSVLLEDLGIYVHFLNDSITTDQHRWSIAWIATLIEKRSLSR